MWLRMAAATSGDIRGTRNNVLGGGKGNHHGGRAQGIKDRSSGDKGGGVGGVFAVCCVCLCGVRGFAELSELEGSRDAVKLVCVPVTSACSVGHTLWRVWHRPREHMRKQNPCPGEQKW
jgi:hypothetical protein